MLFAIEDEIRDFCEENGLEFESEGEFNLYIAELNLLEEKAEERGEDFDWQNGALRYYRVFRGRRDEMNAAGEQKHAVSLSAFNEQELPTLPDELIGGILRTSPSASGMTTRCTDWMMAFPALDTQGRGLVFLNDAAEQAKVTTKTLRQYADFFPEEFDCPPRKGYLRRKKKANTVPAAAPKAAS